jgi:hypothetical protein
MTERRRSSVVQVERADDGIIRINDSSIRKLSMINPQVVQQFDEAKNAAEKEHQLTVRDALKLYPKAIIFSIIFSSAVIMEGYDLSLMGSFFGFPVSASLAWPQPRITAGSTVDVRCQMATRLYQMPRRQPADDNPAFQKFLRH